MSANGKRRYESGAKKRTEKSRKEETATAKTKSIGSFFQKNFDHDTVDTTMTSVLSSSLEPKTNESEKTQEISCKERQECFQDKEEPITYLDQDEETETSCLNEHKPEIFDLSRENPTDRGHFKEDIKNAALKKNIIQDGPCRPCGPFGSVDINGSATTNFSASYYNERHQNMSLPRHWLCYSMVLRMPYCEVWWLFADRSTPNYDMQKGWINGVQGSLHYMLDKIKRHEKSNMYLHASAAYMRWKGGKDFSEENENEIGRQVSFWAKVLQRLISIVLTIATLTLAFRGRREQVHDNVCEGGNFLALVSLMAEYDEFLAEVVGNCERSFLSTSLFLFLSFFCK